MKPAAGTDGFWRFSLALYARPAVAGALIALQDQAGCNVNLILYALWLGVRGCRFAGSEIVAATAAIAPLETAGVAPLRRQRQALKRLRDPDIGALRGQIARLELLAERRVQARLAELATAPVAANPDPLGLAAANLACYLGDRAHSSEAQSLCAALAALIRR